MAKFVAVRNIRNVPAFSLPFDPTIQADYDSKTRKTAVNDWTDKNSRYFKHIPKGARFTIGTADVLSDLSPEEKNKVLLLSIKTDGMGGADRPSAYPVTKESEKWVAVIDKEVAARVKREADQASAAMANPGLGELLGQVLQQQGAILELLAGNKGKAPAGGAT